MRLSCQAKYLILFFILINLVKSRRDGLLLKKKKIKGKLKVTRPSFFFVGGGGEGGTILL